MISASSQDQHLQQDILHALQNKHHDIIQPLISNHQELIFFVLETILKDLETPSSCADRIDFYLDLLYNFVGLFGVSFVLLLNNPKTASIIGDIAYRGHEDKIIELLNLCLQKCSFPKPSSLIPNLTDLYVDLSSDGEFIPSKTEQKTHFINCLLEIKEVIERSKKPMNLFSSDRETFINKIRTILERKDFENKDLSFLEVELIVYQYAELENIASKFGCNLNGMTPMPPLDKKGSAENLKKEEKDSRMSFQNPKREPEEAKELAKPYLFNQSDVSSNLRNYQEPKEMAKPHLKDNLYRKAIALRFRANFLLGETIKENMTGNDKVQLLNFGPPQTDKTAHLMQKNICSFLNHIGGRIYLGIDQDNRVQGVRLNLQERNAFNAKIQEILKTFEPVVPIDNFIQILYLPIFDPLTSKQPIPDLFIIKIIIKQGETNDLYSIRQDSVLCYARKNGEAIQLSSRETKDALLKRDKNSEKRVADSEFIDPEPQARLANSLSQELPKGKVMKSYLDETFEIPKEQGDLSNNIVFKQKLRLRPSEIVFQVLVSELPTGMNKKHFLTFLRPSQFHSYLRYKFIEGEGKYQKPKAYVDFSNFEEANQFIKALNKRTLRDTVLEARFYSS